MGTKSDEKLLQSKGQYGSQNCSNHPRNHPIAGKPQRILRKLIIAFIPTFPFGMEFLLQVVHILLQTPQFRVGSEVTVHGMNRWALLLQGYNFLSL